MGKGFSSVYLVKLAMNRSTEVILDRCRQAYGRALELECGVKERFGSELRRSGNHPGFFVGRRVGRAYVSERYLSDSFGDETIEVVHELVDGRRRPGFGAV